MDIARTSMPFLLPHMPRLDWQMWFAALEFRASGQLPGWMMPFLARLQEGAPAVTSLLHPSGAADTTPVFFRVRLDNLTFTSPAERQSDGRFWRAAPLPAYTIEGRLSVP
jgi:lipase maturation factor 1